MIVVINKRGEESPTSSSYTVPEGGTVLWYGIAADVPANWTIDTGLSGNFVMGATTGGGTDTPAGALTHTHGMPSTGSGASHTHSIGGGTSNSANASTEYYSSGSNNVSTQSHTHSISTSISSSSGAHSHTIGTTDAGDSLPPYRRLYWIKSTGADIEVPINGVVMWNNTIASRPTGWRLCNGINSTPDLVSKFVYASSADGEVNVGGGASTHTHTVPTTGSAGSHNHTMSVSLTGGATNSNGSGYEGVRVSGSHSHGASATSVDDASHTHTTSATDSGSSLPPYVKLYFIMRGA